jgi:hypothetical protein
VGVAANQIKIKLLSQEVLAAVLLVQVELTQRQGMELLVKVITAVLALLQVQHLALEVAVAQAR